MTEFKQIKLMYEQFINLSHQIEKLISDEDYETASTKVEAKDKLLKRLITARKTTVFTAKEKEEVDLINKKIHLKNEELIENLKNKHRDISSQINKTKKQVKITSAYEQPNQQRDRSRYIDTFE